MNSGEFVSTINMHSVKGTRIVSLEGGQSSNQDDDDDVSIRDVYVSLSKKNLDI